MEELIRFENLYKIFNCTGREERRVFELLKAGMNRAEIKQQTGALVALRDISFSVRQGEFFVVMGLSGSGKSTLLRCLNRLVNPTRGGLLLNGKDLLAMGREELTRLRREKMGMVFQSFALFPHRNVLDNVVFGLELQGKNREEVKERGEKALALVGLEGWGENPISALSGGMKQRVGLARALASEPEVLLMDEPFSALDPLIRNRMQEELINLQQELGKTTLFITHDLSEALKLGDRIGMLNGEGELVQVGTPKEILNTPANDYVKGFVENIHKQAELIQSL